MPFKFLLIITMITKAMVLDTGRITTQLNS